MAEAPLNFRNYFQALNWKVIGFDVSLAFHIVLDLSNVSAIGQTAASAKSGAKTRSKRSNTPGAAHARGM
jgi:hypothetical protein